MMFGVHAANGGGMLACTAKADETVWSMMYAKLRANPTPRYIPIPPFLFLADSDAPMMVRMNDANDRAIRL